MAAAVSTPHTASCSKASNHQIGGVRLWPTLDGPLRKLGIHIQ